MERVEKVELIQNTIQQLIEQEQEQEQEQSQAKKSHIFCGDESFVTIDHNTINKYDELVAENRQQLLSQLLTQLDSLKEDAALDQMNQSSNTEETPSARKDEKAEVDENGAKEEKVVKELRKIQKQNFITHCLLSAMIVLTLTWQLSEVSMIWKMKDGLNHPFRSIGSMLTGWIKGPPPVLHGQEGDLNDSAKKLKHQVETLSIPSLKIPELPHMEMPSLDFINEED